MIQILFNNYDWGVEKIEDGVLIHARDEDSKLAVTIPVTNDAFTTLIDELVAARDA